MLMSSGELHAPGLRSELLWVRGYSLAPSLSKLCLFKSMYGNGRQQTEGPQAMKQFGGKSCLGIHIRDCITVEMSVLSLSILVMMTCFALDYCKLNALGHFLTYAENLQMQ